MSDINVDQTVNQAQDQSQDQGQQQQQFSSPTGVPTGSLGSVQRARATNQNVIVGNAGVVTTGAQAATPVNVGGVALGVPRVSGASLTTTTATDGTTTSVLTVPNVTVTIVTPQGGVPAVTVTPT